MTKRHPVHINSAFLTFNYKDIIYDVKEKLNVTILFK